MNAVSGASTRPGLEEATSASSKAGVLRRVPHGWTWWSALLVLVLLFSLITYRIGYFPAAGGDEQNLLGDVYRLTAFGDPHGQIIVAENYNQRVIQKLPFPWVGWVRNGIHLVFGCSSGASRLFSAFSMLLGLVMVAWWLPKRAGAPYVLRLGLLLIVGLSPAFFFAARAVRYEQEIFLIGCAGVGVIPFAIRSTQASWARVALWCAAGVLGGYAAICHPGGAVFSGVCLASILVFARAWEARDGLTGYARLAAYASGLLIPVAIAGLVLKSDLPNWTAYFNDLNSRMVYVKARLVTFWAPQWAWGAWSPEWAAALRAYALSATSPNIAYVHSDWLTALFFFESAIVLVAACCLLIRFRCRYEDLPLRTVTILAAGFILFHFWYAFRASPNYTYFPYLGAFVPLAFCWLCMHGSMRAWASQQAWRRKIALLLMLPLAVVLISWAHFQLAERALIRKAGDAGKLVSLDDQLTAIRQVGARLGWTADSRAVYIDNLTWAAAGPQWRSIFEWMLADHARPPDAADRVCYQRQLCESLFDYPGFGRVQLTPEQRRERMRALLGPRDVAALLFDGSQEYYFYAPRAETAAHAVLVTRTLTPGRVRWAETLEPVPLSQANKEEWICRSLHAGSYLTLLRGGGLPGATVTIACGEPGRGAFARVETSVAPTFNDVAVIALLLDVPTGAQTLHVTTKPAGTMQVTTYPLTAWESGEVDGARKYLGRLLQGRGSLPRSADGQKLVAGSRCPLEKIDQVERRRHHSGPKQSSGRRIRILEPQ